MTLPATPTEKVISVIQGQYHISADPNTRMTTVLGSCIACCLFDAEKGIGGMNHFLLAGDANQAGVDVKFGSYAMEMLINSLLKQGADKSKLKAKLFGGGNITAALKGIGEKNARFAQQFLSRENIPTVSDSLGGQNARRIHFWPTTGAVKLMIVPRTDIPEEKIHVPRERPAAQQVELF